MPFTAKLAGDVSLVLNEPVKPTVTDEDGAIVELYGSAVAVTFSVDWTKVAFQRLVICWSPGKVQVSVQPLIGAVPVLVTTTCAWKPLLHELTTE